MKKIYILLMHTNTYPSKFVKFMTNYKYSHVALSLDDSCDILYSFGRKKLNKVLDGGFSVENKDGEFFKKFNNANCKIYELDVKEEQYAKLKDTIKDMENNKDNYKYDFIGTAFRFFNIPVTFKDKYVCSYFVASILENNEIYKFNKNTCFMKPKDFEGLEGFNEIYSGKYCLYK